MSKGLGILPNLTLATGSPLLLVTMIDWFYLNETTHILRPSKYCLRLSIWNYSDRFLISSSVCKQFRSCHPILTTSRKLNRLKLTTFPGWVRKVRTLQTSAPVTGSPGAYKQSMLTKARRTSRNLGGSQSQGRKTWPVIDDLLEAQCRKLWELKTPRGTHSFVRFTSRAHKVVTVSTTDKPPCTFSRGRGKGAILEYKKQHS